MRMSGAFLVNAARHIKCQILTHGGRAWENVCEGWLLHILAEVCRTVSHDCPPLHSQQPPHLGQSGAGDQQGTSHQRRTTTLMMCPRQWQEACRKWMATLQCPQCKISPASGLQRCMRARPRHSMPAGLREISHQLQLHEQRLNTVAMEASVCTCN